MQKEKVRYKQTAKRFGVVNMRLNPVIGSAAP